SRDRAGLPGHADRSRRWQARHRDDLCPLVPALDVAAVEHRAATGLTDVEIDRGRGERNTCLLAVERLLRGSEHSPARHGTIRGPRARRDMPDIDIDNVRETERDRRLACRSAVA